MSKLQPPPDLRVEAIPAFTDNYIWWLYRGGAEAVVVDPGDAVPVLEALQAAGQELAGILVTHHHADHIGGIPTLLERWPDIPVWGPVDERLGDWCRPHREGDEVEIAALGLRFTVLDVPAHTRSHIAFCGHGLLFCGDTLFSVGCGRFFEGTPADMQVALDKLAQLPDDTLVYCTHEYTLSNCRFAQAVEPENRALAQRTADVEAARAEDRITLPTRIGAERAVNPFLRTREPSVIAAAQAQQADAAPGESTMGILRAWKDSF